LQPGTVLADIEGAASIGALARGEDSRMRAARSLGLSRAQCKCRLARHEARMGTSQGDRP